MCENFCGLNFVDETKSTKTLKIPPLKINPLYSKQISIANQYLPYPFPMTATRSHHPLNYNSFIQEQIFITTHFYPEQFLIGTIYLLRKLMS